ncbi:hypothetical protein ON021_22750, partial [Microcoleus sp. HI-ES]|nr:hypothetical protein [Microcoleus sp. HI-ES]
MVNWRAWKLQQLRTGFHTERQTKRAASAGRTYTSAIARSTRQWKQASSYKQKSNKHMVDSLKKPTFEEMRPGVKAPAKETILTPRFYTTDFDEMAKMDISVNEAELEAIIQEFRVDYNKNHF